MMERIDNDKNIQYYYLKDDGVFPNNAKLPVLFFKDVIPKKSFGAEEIKQLLQSNGWEKPWTDTIFDYQHYHSTAHEVMVALEGNIHLKLGGENGITVHFEKGDVLVIPAGVAHKNLDPKNKFTCLGAYPKGQDYDMNYGRNNERDRADQNIEQLSLPKNDPLFGEDGPLMKYWVAVQQATEG